MSLSLLFGSSDHAPEDCLSFLPAPRTIVEEGQDKRGQDKPNQLSNSDKERMGEETHSSVLAHFFPDCVDYKQKVD